MHTAGDRVEERLEGNLNPGLDSLHLTSMQLYGIGGCSGDAASCMRRRVILQLGCGGRSGWAVAELEIADRHFDLIRWSSCLMPLRRMTLEQAWLAAWRCRHQWGEDRSELLLSALEDLEVEILSGRRHQGKPVLHDFGRLEDISRMETSLLNLASSYLEVL